MYTSGTTGDPKGVMISNNSIVTLIAGVKRFLEGVNESVNIHHLTYYLFCCKHDNILLSKRNMLTFNVYYEVLSVPHEKYVNELVV